MNNPEAKGLTLQHPQMNTHDLVLIRRCRFSKWTILAGQVHPTPSPRYAASCQFEPHVCQYEQS